MSRMLALNDAGYRIGESRANTKLTDHDVELMLQLHEEGMRPSVLAEKFEVSRMHVWRITNGRSRSQLATRWKRAA